MSMDQDQTQLVQAAADRLRRKEAKHQEKLRMRREAAQALARTVAIQLGKRDDRISRVIGFGSTFELWRNYRLDSDIDLAIIGGDWYEATRDLPVSDIEISIIELSTQTESFRQDVLEYGVVLYEKQ
ncbi:MAG: hypothetical protein ACLFNT_09185 [Spirochaetales bacterium]